MKTLLMFGDSWAAGAELSDDEKPFGKILAESNNLIYKDFSLQGCSNPKMLLQLNDAIEKNDHEDSIAIFFLTSYTRIINWRDIAKSTINAAGLDDIDKNYAKYFYTDEAGHFNTVQTILSLQKICSKYNIKDFYVPGWLEFKLDFPGIDLNKIFNEGKGNIATAIGMPKFGNEITEEHKKHNLIHPKNWHPNQKAHQLIADRLQNWIFTNNSSRL